jgi:hypothetical protein
MSAEIHHENKPTLLPTLIGGLVGFLLFGVIVLWMLKLAGPVEDYDQKRAKERTENLRKLHEEEAKILSSYDWADKPKNIVKIPIQQAMDLEIETLKAKPVKAAYPVVVPVAPATAAPTAPPVMAPVEAKK